MQSLILYPVAMRLPEVRGARHRLRGAPELLTRSGQLLYNAI